MAGTIETKRSGGQVKDENWLVLTESTKQKEGGWIHSCGETIIVVRVAHPIWDGPFPFSGSGRCHYEELPYCPKCEEGPDFHGSPIYSA